MSLKRYLATAFALATAAAFTLPLNAQTSTDTTLSGNTPGFVKKAADLGPADASQQIDVTVWLELQHEQQLQNLIQAQHTKNSPQWHKWISQADFNAQFSPTSNQINAVSNYLSAKNLQLVSVADNNFYVKVRGSIADVQKAFHVQIDNYKFNGQTYRSNKNDPSVNSSSGSHVAAITGLDDYGYHPNVHRMVDQDGNARTFPLAKSPDGVFSSATCFTGTTTATFSRTVPLQGTSSGTYSGNQFNSAFCGYSAHEIEKAYGFNSVYAQNILGQGQTIVIVDGYGSPTIQYDANAFSYYEGLPPVNLTLIKAPGLTNGPNGESWQDEVTLDVEWAHAAAPAANIVLVTSTTRSSLDEAINLAVSRGLGNTISNSWSTVEGFGNPRSFDRVNRILWNAAAKGINVNFSSGDNGDNVARVGFVTVDFPSSSPYATSVGGTSLQLNPDGTIAFQTGWGNNETRIAQSPDQYGQAPTTPPINFGFLYGSGGGSSYYYARPDFQSALTVPGNTRVTPDVSMFADPFTGAEIILTDPSTGQLVGGVIGGTSLACPVFSGISALAAQKAGHGLGQVGATSYALAASDPGTFTDISIPDTSHNVTGSTNVNGVITNYTADQLVQPHAESNDYFSALWHSSSNSRWYVLSFGTDSTLQVTPGWDNVTGLGTPNVPAFVNALATY